VTVFAAVGALGMLPVVELGELLPVGGEPAPLVVWPLPVELAVVGADAPIATMPLLVVLEDVEVR